MYVYLDSEKQKRRWESLASHAGASLSEFVADVVEDRLRRDEDPDYRSRGDLSKELQELREANSRLLEERRMREALVEKLEGEARRYRSELFLEGPTGTKTRRYDTRLVDMLRSSGTVKHDDLLRMLKIPAMDALSVRAVSEQLEGLQGYGLVKATPRGWRWIG